MGRRSSVVMHQLIGKHRKLIYRQHFHNIGIGKIFADYRETIIDATYFNYLTTF